MTFDIDANGILNVTAHDKATGKEQKVTITASTNLNKDEIERMVQRGARSTRPKTARRKELVEARNQADTLAYQTEKTLRELGDKVPATERQNIEAKIKALREAAAGDDASQIKRQTDDLQNAFHALSQQLYAQQAHPGNPASAATAKTSQLPAKKATLPKAPLPTATLSKASSATPKPRTNTGATHVGRALHLIGYQIPRCCESNGVFTFS